MNPIVVALIVIPTVILIYKIGKAAGRGTHKNSEYLLNEFRNTASYLQDEADEWFERHESMLDENTSLRMAAMEMNRRLGGCVCGQRLSHDQELGLLELDMAVWPEHFEDNE
jgi:hypothetical protein